MAYKLATRPDLVDHFIYITPNFTRLVWLIMLDGQEYAEVQDPKEGDERMETMAAEFREKGYKVDVNHFPHARHSLQALMVKLRAEKK